MTKSSLQLKSNLRLKSNVYLRKRDDLLNDLDFIRRIRGLKAVRELLQIMGISSRNCRYDDPAIRNLVRQGKLTKSQQKTIKWELRCIQCNAIPCGENFQGELEFRCEVQGCVIRRPSRTILVPVSVIKNKRLYPQDALLWAIKECHERPPIVDLSVRPQVPIPLMVDATIDWLFSDEELAAFLVYGFLNYAEG